MAEHGDMGVVLNITYEGIRAAWNNQIDKPFSLKQGVHLFAVIKKYICFGWRTCACRCAVNDCKERSVRFFRLTSSLEHDGIAALQTQRCNLRERIGTRFKYGSDYADGTAYPIEHQPTVQLCSK